MKYCITWYGDNNSKMLEKAEEINIDLSKVKDLTDLPEFCEQHPNQRINLCIDDFEDGMNEGYFKIALDYQKDNPDKNIYVRLPWYNEAMNAVLLDYPDSKHFFNMLVNTWDVFYGLAESGVSDIYITGDLGFELDKIQKIAHEREDGEYIQIRVFPNIAMSDWKYLDDIKKFFIRPEDVGMYNEYIDVFEFWGDLEKQDIYYSIYKKDKEWFGRLNEIIIGFDSLLNSKTTLPRFSKKRIKCGRQCLKGGSCHMCNSIEALSENLEKAGLFIDKKED